MALQGYLIRLVVDSDENDEIKFWGDDRLPTENLDTAMFFASKQDAKITTAQISSIYADHDIDIVPAVQSTTLK